MSKLIKLTGVGGKYQPPPGMSFFVRASDVRLIEPDVRNADLSDCGAQVLINVGHSANLRFHARETTDQIHAMVEAATKPTLEQLVTTEEIEARATNIERERCAAIVESLTSDLWSSATIVSDDVADVYRNIAATIRIRAIGAMRSGSKPQSK